MRYTRNSSEGTFQALSDTDGLLFEPKVRLVNIAKYGSVSPWLKPAAAAASSNTTRKLLLMASVLPQNVPTIHTQKVGIAYQGTPLGLREAQQLLRRQPPDLTRIGAGRTCMIQNIALPIVLKKAGAQVDHAVISFRAGALAEEE